MQDKLSSDARRPVKKYIFILTILSTSLLIGQKTGSIVGRITDEATGKPLKSAIITVNAISLRVTSNENGWYDLGSMLAGNREIEFSCPGYRKLVMVNTTVRPDRIDTVNVQLAIATSEGQVVVIISKPVDTLHTLPVKIRPIRKAMTWKKISHDDKLGIDIVGCAGCNAYSGDVRVTEELPVLAIKKEGLPRPPYGFGGCKDCAREKEYYYGWAGGHIALTKPIKGSELTSLQKANEYCEQQCGKGYRMAEFHDGEYVVGMNKEQYYGETWLDESHRSRGAWNFFAYGNIPADTRFWVYIDDQPANCWEQTIAHYESDPSRVEKSQRARIPKVTTEIASDIQSQSQPYIGEVREFIIESLGANSNVQVKITTYGKNLIWHHANERTVKVGEGKTARTPKIDRREIMPEADGWVVEVIGPLSPVSQKLWGAQGEGPFGATESVFMTDEERISYWVSENVISVSNGEASYGLILTCGRLCDTEVLRKFQKLEVPSKRSVK